MTNKNTYIQPQIKLYAVSPAGILTGSDPVTKSVSVGGNDTDTQLSKGISDSEEDW